MGHASSSHQPTFFSETLQHHQLGIKYDDVSCFQTINRTQYKQTWAWKKWVERDCWEHLCSEAPAQDWGDVGSQAAFLMTIKLPFLLCTKVLVLNSQFSSFSVCFVILWSSLQGNLPPPGSPLIPYPTPISHPLPPYAMTFVFQMGFFEKIHPEVDLDGFWLTVCPIFICYPDKR